VNAIAGNGQLTPAAHIVEESQAGGPRSASASECGGGEFQCVEAGLGGRDQFAQVASVLRRSASRLVGPGSGYINRQRDVGDGLIGS